MGGPWVQKRVMGSSGHCVGCGLTWGHGHGAPQAGEGHGQQPQHLQVVLRGSWTPSTNFGKGGRKLRLVWTEGCRMQGKGPLDPQRPRASWLWGVERRVPRPL